MEPSCLGGCRCGLAALLSASLPAFMLVIGAISLNQLSLS